MVWALTISFNYGQGVRVDASFPFAIGFSDTITPGGGTTPTRVDTLVRDTTGNYSGSTAKTSLFIRKISGTSVGMGLYKNLRDTVKQYWSASIVADDTLEVSTVASFPNAEKIIVLPDVPLTLGPFNVIAKTNFYIRPRAISGGTGLTRYYLYIYGW